METTDEKVKTTISVDARALGFDPTQATVTELTQNKPLTVDAEEGTLGVSLDLDEDEPASLQVKPR